MMCVSTIKKIQTDKYYISYNDVWYEDRRKSKWMTETAKHLNLGLKPQSGPNLWRVEISFNVKQSSHGGSHVSLISLFICHKTFTALFCIMISSFWLSSEKRQKNMFIATRVFISFWCRHHRHHLIIWVSQWSRKSLWKEKKESRSVKHSTCVEEDLKRRLEKTVKMVKESEYRFAHNI